MLCQCCSTLVVLTNYCPKKFFYFFICNDLFYSIITGLETGNMANSNLNESLNVSSSSIFASTPFKVPGPGTWAKKCGKKKGKVYVRPVCDTCEVCGKEYRCHRSYLNHMRQHAIKGINIITYSINVLLISLIFWSLS